MQLEPASATAYVRLAFDQMVVVADRLGDEDVNRRPHGPDTNAVAAVVLHCCGSAEFWLGHVGRGRPSERARDEEFSLTATVVELHTAVDAAIAQIESDIAAIDAGATSEFAAGRQFLTVDDGSDGALVLHVLEELFQHLGHIELTADALRRGR